MSKIVLEALADHAAWLHAAGWPSGRGHPRADASHAFCGKLIAQGYGKFGNGDVPSGVKLVPMWAAAHHPRQGAMVLHAILMPIFTHDGKTRCNALRPCRSAKQFELGIAIMPTRDTHASAARAPKCIRLAPKSTNIGS